VHFTTEARNTKVTNPFLSKRVLNVVDSRVPHVTNAHQARRPEAGLGHNGKVCVECRTDLDQSQLTVRHTKQSTAQQSHISK